MSFEKCRQVEAQSLAILRPFIEQRAYNGQYVITSKGRLSRELQKTVGDVILNDARERVWSVELKAEKSYPSKKNGNGERIENLFLETWSNKSRYTVGWMYTLNADFLLYHFIKDQHLYITDFQKLKKWAFHSNRIWDFPERLQSKNEQLNDTWGRCVPIRILVQEVGTKLVTVNGLEITEPESAITKYLKPKQQGLYE